MNYEANSNITFLLFIHILLALFCL